MDYLDKLRRIVNEINIGGSDAGEGSTDNNDAAPAPEPADDEDSDENNFMDDDSGGSEDTGGDEDSDENNFMDDEGGGDDEPAGDEGGDAAGDEDSDENNFMDDEGGGDDESTGDEGGEEGSDEGGENFMDDGGDEGGGEDSGESEEESEEGSDEGEESGEEEPGYDIKKIEDELFSSLTPEQIAIKNHELKNQFIELYSIIGGTLVRINDISKSNENVNVLKFITEKLLELREMIDFNITTAYQTRTYIENNIIYQQCIATLNAIAQIIDTIPNLDGNKTVDDEETEDKGVPVEQDEESSESLEISDSSVTNYQEESYDYSYEYNDLF